MGEGSEESGAAGEAGEGLQRRLLRCVSKTKTENWPWDWVTERSLWIMVMVTMTVIGTACPLSGHPHLIITRPIGGGWNGYLIPLIRLVY